MDISKATPANEEEWREIPRYGGLYEASNKGRIKSKWENTRISDKENHIMRQKYDGRGYKRVNLYDGNGNYKAELVSRLVAEAFIPNPDNLPQVGHDDDDKTNNDVSNLYWTNSVENNRHNGKLEQFQQAHRDKIDIIAEKLSVKVTATSLTDSETLYFDSMQEAARNGFSSGKISMCVNGKRKSHKGYRWERTIEEEDNET